MLFVRWHIAEKNRIVASRCHGCDRLVGCSHRPESLDIAERAHAAASHAEKVCSSIKINSADAMLFSVLEPILRSR